MAHDFVLQEMTHKRRLWDTEVSYTSASRKHNASKHSLTPPYHQISNQDLKKRYLNLAKGLVKSVGLIPEKSVGVMLLDDSFGMLNINPSYFTIRTLNAYLMSSVSINVEWLLIDLALSTLGIQSHTPTRLSLLAPILEHHPSDVIFSDVTLLESVVEQVAELGTPHSHFPIVVVGNGASAKAEASRNMGFNVVSLEEVELVGREEDEENILIVESRE